MSLQYKDIHPCDKPSMVVGSQEVPVKTSFFGLFTKTTMQTVTSYETRSAKWTCPVCGSKWSWLTNGSDLAFWICDERPERWVDK